MSNPHVLVIPYPAQGHVIPLMEFSQSLAEHGLKITFVNTEDNHKRIINTMTTTGVISTGDQIKLVSVPDGLDETSEDRNKPGKYSEAILQFMPGEVDKLIKDINKSGIDNISCVIADQSIGWALEIAEKNGIKRAAFCPAAAAMLVLGFSIGNLVDDGIIDNDGTPIRKQTIKLSPTMPEMSTENFVWTCLGNKAAQRNIFSLMVANNRSIKLTEWVLCNSSYDLEPAACDFSGVILPIGPLSASTELTGNFWTEDATCLEWLDQQRPLSVIYVAFGSLTIFNQRQFEELALGLELSGRPYLWVVRPDGRIKDEYLKGVTEKGADCGGRVVVGWVPQQKVLSHPAVACFVSHCGWNSTVESVSNGVPILCCPYFADQFVNRTYVCDVWKVGFSLDRDESGVVTGSEIRKKVDQVMVDGVYKARALDLKKKVSNSIKEGGNSATNFKNFVKWIKEM